MEGRISVQDFEEAITALHDLSRNSEAALWRHSRLIQSSGAKGLRLVRDDDSPAVKHAHSSTTHVDQPCIYEDDDEEALAAPQAKLAFQTFFDIIHSPTYGVPVLYVYSKTVSSPIGSESDDQEHLPYMGKDSAIPHPQPRAYLSMTDHPWLSIPVMFIHPCRTGEAMHSLHDGSDRSPLDYIIAWCGLVGGVAGLNVPIDIATSGVVGSRRQP